jgi:hypothetical protein
MTETRGKWDKDQLLDFLALTSERRLVELEQPGLFESLLEALGLQIELRKLLGSKAERRAQYRRVVLAHPVAKVLAGDQRFCRALKLFEVRRAKEKTGALADPLADIRFWHVIAWTCMRMRPPHTLNRKQSIRRDTRSALSHARRLATLMDAKNIRMRNSQDNTRFRASLKDFIQELRGPRAAKSGPQGSAWERDLVRWLADELKEKFGLSGAILSELAAMVGYERDASTIYRLTKRT